MRGREFTELQAFALVAEEGSFTRAALRLQLAPSTLSQIIRELEERLGFAFSNAPPEAYLSAVLVCDFSAGFSQRWSR